MIGFDGEEVNSSVSHPNSAQNPVVSRKKTPAKTKEHKTQNADCRQTNKKLASTMAKEPQPDDSGDPNSSGEKDEVNSHQEDQDDSDQEGEEVAVKPRKKKKVHKLTLAETENFNEKLRKRGVIYIARVPPRMTPTKVKSLLSDFCEVTRVYLVEEDQTIRKRRKKERGSSGGKRYNEGWVELSSKRKAKHVAASLNNTPISNHKRNPHCGMKSEHT